MVVTGFDLVEMANVASMSNMRRIEARLTAIHEMMLARDIEQVRITGLGGLQGDTLRNLRASADRIREEMGNEAAENERNSEAYRMGRL